MCEEREPYETWAGAKLIYSADLTEKLLHDRYNLLTEPKATAL